MNLHEQFIEKFYATFAKQNSEKMLYRYPQNIQLQNSAFGIFK